MKEINLNQLEELLGSVSQVENSAEITSSELIEKLNTVINISKFCLKVSNLSLGTN